MWVAAACSTRQPGATSWIGLTIGARPLVATDDWGGWPWDPSGEVGEGRPLPGAQEGQHEEDDAQDDRDDQVPVVHRGVVQVSSVAVDCPPRCASAPGTAAPWCGPGRWCRTPPRQVDAGPD